MILKCCVFSVVMLNSSWKGVVMASGYFTDVVLHSLKNYHNERGARLRRLSENFPCVFGVVILCFHGDFNLCK